MKITMVLAALIWSFVLACSSGAPDPTEPAFKIEQDSKDVPQITPSATLTSMPFPSPQPTPTSSQIVRGKPDPAIKVNVFNREKVWPGTTLLNDNHDEEWPRIIEVNMLGEVVWEYVISRDLWEGEPHRSMDRDVELLENGNILLGLPQRGIFEIDRGGEVVWSHLDEKISHDVDRLPNGNTLYNFGGGDTINDVQVKEVSPSGEIVWSWQAKNHFSSNWNIIFIFLLSHIVCERGGGLFFFTSRISHKLL